ncbi:hypothetical protein [Cryobacterium sp. M25]|uniref:hypothetical protein n=1 Tax=Cryobacterium sp. M25 TaxID=2048293 RepID=UPI0011B0B53A|nr:hypothetical protein [Cryobacterium sp. M25]
MSSNLEPVSTQKLIPNFENPRHLVVETTEEAIAALMSKMPRKILSLATDIVTYGLDPSSLPIVVADGDSYIALEGNRRVVALRLIHNPWLIELESPYLEAFEALHLKEAVPDEVLCIVVDERAEADHWIELRHTGENGGAGTVPWGSPEQNRFRKQRGSQTDAAMRFAEAMRTLFPDETQFLRDVDKVEAEVSTTLGRVIQNPERRAHFGFEQLDGVLYVRHNVEELLPLLERLFRDLASGTENATNLRDKSYLENYMDRMLNEVPHERSRLEKPIAVGEWAAAQVAIGTQTDEEATRGDGDGNGEGQPDGGEVESEDTIGGLSASRRKRNREELHIFQGISLKHMDLRTADVLKEAQKLYIDTSPNLCAVMLRVVLDLVSASFYSFRGRTNADNTEFKAKILSCANTIDPTCKEPSLARARVLIQSDGALSPKTMNGYVHAWNKSPLSKDIRELSAAYGPLLVKIDEYIRDNPRE